MLPNKNMGIVFVILNFFVNYSKILGKTRIYFIQKL
jgi:hypothetical protein